MRFVATFGILGIGEILVIITGGIDLAEIGEKIVARIVGAVDDFADEP